MQTLKLIWHFGDLRLPFLSDIRIIPPKSTQFPHHGIGVVIGRNVTLGENVVIYHGVTIGAHCFHSIYNNVAIGDNVVIYPNTVIVGDITIGDNAIIGAHSYIDYDVVENETIIRGNNE